MGKTKVAICEWTLPMRGVEAVRTAAALGFDGIQITELGGYEAGFPLLLEENLHEYQRVVEETGIVLHSLHLWSLCRLVSLLHPLESSAGKIGLLSLKNGLDACMKLGIDRLMVTSGLMCQTKNEDDFKIWIEYMNWLCDRAALANITVCFESCFSAKQILRVFNETGRRIRVCYDFFNPIRFHCGDPLAEERILLPEGCIDHFHVKDGPETCIGCTLLGEGIGNYNGQTAYLKQAGYNGWLLSENYYVDMALNYGIDYKELAKRDCETMKRYYDE